jgi:hypothetical protein
MRTRTLLLLATAVTLATIGGVGVGIASGGPARPEREPTSVGAAASPAARASRVLAAWDSRRAAAWARGDASALAALYTRSSATGARDVTDLRRWRDRRLRVVGLRQQVTRLRVLVDRPRRIVVEATERTVHAIAVAGHRRTALPVSAWSTHRIRLRHGAGRWLVAEVDAQPAR